MTTSADESTLLAAIAADLEDDTVRLAYADWLDEHGDAAGRDRAELIRIQVELSKRRDVIEAHKPTLVYTPQIRERELIEAHPEWTRCPYCAGIGFGGAGQGGHTSGARCDTCNGLGWLLPRDVEWDRGFPGWVTLPTWDNAVNLNEWGHEQHYRLPTPTPRLRALAKLPPWGVPLRGVRIAEAKPYHNVAGWCWYDRERERPRSAGVPVESEVPTVVFLLLSQWERHKAGGKRWRPYRTERAALDDLAAAVLEFGRRG